jgi:hypothetical protein
MCQDVSRCLGLANEASNVYRLNHRPMSREELHLGREWLRSERSTFLVGSHTLLMSPEDLNLHHLQMTTLECTSPGRHIQRTCARLETMGSWHAETKAFLFEGRIDDGLERSSTQAQSCRKIQRYEVSSSSR